MAEHNISMPSIILYIAAVGTKRCISKLLTSQYENKRKIKTKKYYEVTWASSVGLFVDEFMLRFTGAFLMVHQISATSPGMVLNLKPGTV